MDIEERIRTCQLIEQMQHNTEFTERLGMEDRSTYRGMPVSTYMNPAEKEDYRILQSDESHNR